MDALQAITTSIGVIGLVLIMVLLVLHFFGPKTAAWIHSNREEKMSFSKNRIYNANGYLIQHSGSELLLTSTGSFKRFESIDRDLKGNDQSPSWNITIPEIPPQPLRIAPKSPTHRERKKSLENLSPEKYCDVLSQNRLNDKSTVIPRPTTKRQFSSPANCGVAHINLSDVVAKINNGPKSCTNPFLNGSLSISEDDNSNSIAIDVNNSGQVKTTTNTTVAHATDEKLQKNPFTFTRRRQDDISFFSFPSNGNIDDNPATNTRYDITETTETLIELNETTTSTKAEPPPTANLLKTTSFSPTFFGHINETTQHIQIHNRSLSDSGSSKVASHSIYEQTTPTTNPFASAGNLHKTVSDTYLGQYSAHSEKQTIQNRDTTGHQSNPHSCREPANHLQTPINLNEGELKRAMSCDSVNSESSVLLADLEQQQQQVPTVTGLLCVGLQYDKNTLTDEGIELVLTVMEAKELIGPPDAEKFDTFVRIYMVPDDTHPQQTKLFRNSKCPSYNETISFWLSNKRPVRRSLWFALYHTGNVHTLIGETEFQIGDVRRPITTWLTLSDSRLNNSPYGELMFSLSYLPTAERLTVVVVKARNLKLNDNDTMNNSPQNIFVKVYLQKDDKKVSKKKTSVKRADSTLIYNEAMIFSVPPYMLNAIQIRLTVVSSGSETTSSSSLIENSNTIGGSGSGGGGGSGCVKPIGHVIVGCSANDKGLRHWNQMMTSLRKPVAMWHALRQASHPTVTTT